MLVVPVKRANGRDEVIIVLDKTNIERMKEADPVILEQLGPYVLFNPKVTICYEDQSPELTRLVHGRDLNGLVEFLTRGFKFRPERGDHDRGPEDISGLN